MIKAEKIQRAMERHQVLSIREAEEAIEFVRALLEIDIEETQINEPYATASINEMRIAVNRLSYLDEILK